MAVMRHEFACINHLPDSLSERVPWAGSSSAGPMPPCGMGSHASDLITTFVYNPVEPFGFYIIVYDPVNPYRTLQPNPYRAGTPELYSIKSRTPTAIHHRTAAGGVCSIDLKSPSPHSGQRRKERRNPYSSPSPHRGRRRIMKKRGTGGDKSHRPFGPFGWWVGKTKGSNPLMGLSQNVMYV